jgi:hypothetical protein
MPAICEFKLTISALILPSSLGIGGKNGFLSSSFFGLVLGGVDIGVGVFIGEGLGAIAGLPKPIALPIFKELVIFPVAKFLFLLVVLLKVFAVVLLFIEGCVDVSGLALVDDVGDGANKLLDLLLPVPNPF